MSVKNIVSKIATLSSVAAQGFVSFAGVTNALA